MSRQLKSDSIQISNYLGSFIDCFCNGSINPIWQQNLGTTSNLGSFTEDNSKLTLTYPSGTPTRVGIKHGFVDWIRFL